MTAHTPLRLPDAHSAITLVLLLSMALGITGCSFSSRATSIVGATETPTRQAAVTPDVLKEAHANAKYVDGLTKDPNLMRADTQGWSAPLGAVADAPVETELSHTSYGVTLENSGVPAVVVGYVSGENIQLVAIFHSKHLYFAWVGYNGSRIKLVSPGTWNPNSSSGGLEHYINGPDLPSVLPPKTPIKFGISGVSTPQDEQTIHQSGSDDSFYFFLQGTGPQPPSVSDDPDALTSPDSNVAATEVANFYG